MLVLLAFWSVGVWFSIDVLGLSLQYAQGEAKYRDDSSHPPVDTEIYC
jgi:hypothetical protein